MVDLWCHFTCGEPNTRWGNPQRRSYASYFYKKSCGSEGESLVEIEAVSWVLLLRFTDVLILELIPLLPKQVSSDPFHYFKLLVTESFFNRFGSDACENFS